ncbi:MAG TPA: cyclase family protein [Candidatus Limnocylindria bacterium]|nr:cyclase family protein [Candidatus Limnocylindria bacterium]
MNKEAFQTLFDECSNWGRWGADDERGALNLIPAASAVRAAALVKTGRTVSCALPLNTVADVENMRPIVHAMLRAGDVVSAEGGDSLHDMIVVSPHGFAHTHLDALCHFVWKGKIYNGRSVATVTSVGSQRSAITAAQDGIVTRGVLLDIPRLKGAQWLEPGTSIMPADLDAAEAAGKVRVGEGDVLLVRTGRQLRRRTLGPWEFLNGAAGLHYSCARWLRERGVAVLGCDGVSDVFPSGIPEVRLPIHVLTLVAMGIHLLDNLDLEALAEAAQAHQRAEFLLTIAPLRLERGTASLVNPIAVF